MTTGIDDPERLNEAPERANVQLDDRIFWLSKFLEQCNTELEERTELVRKLKAENERLRELLECHGRHSALCNWEKEDQCACGWIQTRDRNRAELERKE